mmetsp:Transcript_24591/g.37427  ORF Transcript_24591/g.37427 Transcript_24591/m.37427 type:complete len:92 (+) Transcript_24591:1-276(+)
MGRKQRKSRKPRPLSGHEFISDDILNDEGVIVSSEAVGEERRFVLRLDVKGSGSTQASSLCDRDILSGESTLNTTFAKHQVNYSATKYIKP